MRNRILRLIRLRHAIDRRSETLDVAQVISAPAGFGWYLLRTHVLGENIRRRILDRPRTQVAPAQLPHVTEEAWFLRVMVGLVGDAKQVQVHFIPWN